MPGINYPIPPEWDQYVTQMEGQLEVIPDILYDALTFTDNTTTTLTFFNGVRANLSLSNMTQAGQLPAPESFLIEFIHVFFRTTVETVDAGAAGALASQIGDIVLVSNTGRGDLVLGHKNYGPYLLHTLPAGAFMKGMLSQAGGEAANLTQAYGQLDGPLFHCSPNLMISPQQNFSFPMNWPAAVNTSADIIIEVQLRGKRARAIN